jgi:hypothetical protein
MYGDFGDAAEVFTELDFEELEELPHPAMIRVTSNGTAQVALILRRISTPPRLSKSGKTTRTHANPLKLPFCVSANYSLVREMSTACVRSL